METNSRPVNRHNDYYSQRRIQENYRRKYLSLKRKCDSLELSNERVLNRLCHVKKYSHKLSRERRGLAKKLTELGDEFKKSDLTIPLEDDLPGSGLGPGDSPSPSQQATADTQDGLSPTATNGPAPAKTEEGAAQDASHSSAAGLAKSGKKKRSRELGKSEKEKDPNAPKKPANAFLMYCQQERQKVQDGQGNGIYPAELSHQDLTRQLARQWKFLSEEEKRHYYLMYEKEKDRYDKAVKRYVKAGGGDRKNPKREEENADSETIDVVKTAQDKEKKRKELKEEKVTMKAVSSSEDLNVDVEKDEFEFTDYTVVVDEPKICLEKIDKSKLFDKARLFGLTASEASDRSQSHQETNRSRPASASKPIRELLLQADAKPAKGPGMSDLQAGHRPVPTTSGLSQLSLGQSSLGQPMLGQALGGRPTLSQAVGGHHPAMSVLPGVQVRPPGEVSIKELVGVRPGMPFEMRNTLMMELKNKAEESTVLASALRNQPVFDLPSGFPLETSKPKPGDFPGTQPSSSQPTSGLTTDTNDKTVGDIRRSTIAEQLKEKLPTDSNPRSFVDSKPKASSELRDKPAGSEARGFSVGDNKVKPSPEAYRRMSMETKRPVVELKKFPVDPSDDPYHFDD